MVVLAPKVVTMDTKVFYYLFLCDTHMFSFSTKISYCDINNLFTQVLPAFFSDNLCHVMSK